MKKILIISLSVLVLAVGNSVSAGVSIGTRSEEVKNIQEALRSDASVFPGQATGYFGQITQKAVQKVQAKCNLPQTGVVDDQTYKCIFPVDYLITVVSPNGGETWDRGQIQTIKWNFTYPMTLETNNAQIMPPYWSKASIDLFRRSSATDDPGYIFFVRHIAVVNLFDRSYSWKVASDIPNGSDYVVRISVGQGIMPLYRAENDETNINPEQIWPSPLINWDESDAPFTITGSIVPPNPIPELKQVLESLQQVAAQLAKTIQLLQEIIAKQ